VALLEEEGSWQTLRVGSLRLVVPA
jgi:hypothetical protein